MDKNPITLLLILIILLLRFTYLVLNLYKFKGDILYMLKVIVYTIISSIVLGIIVYNSIYPV